MINEVKTVVNNNRNYIIIGILSLMAVVFLPMLGSSVGLGFNIPNTIAGWVVYIITKLSIVCINLLIFDQFMKRAKVNVQTNERFKQAEEILSDNDDDEEEEPLPAEYYIKHMYRNKMITTAIFTILGVFGFTNAILTFDWVSMLSYVFTITMALVFGWISMVDAEAVWIDKHYKYAKKVERERKKLLIKESNDDNN